MYDLGLPSAGGDKPRPYGVFVRRAPVGATLVVARPTLVVARPTLAVARVIEMYNLGLQSTDGDKPCRCGGRSP